MIVLGLTGSVAMGKSTTAEMFRAAGVPVWDADAAVHSAYAPGGAAVQGIAALVPEALCDGGIDRAVLRERIAADPALLDRIESVVHPLVRQDRETFLAQAEADGQEVAVIDIPLLFETGAETEVDAVVVVTAPPDMQRARFLERDGASDARLDAILARQTPDVEKRARADYIIDTSNGIEAARRRVAELLAELTERDPENA